MTDPGVQSVALLEQLDFLYTPSVDVAADTSWFADVLGARVVFTIEDSGTRVAMLELTSAPPRVLLTDHLDGERPILIYRVVSLAHAMAELASHGWEPERTLEIPMGPCCSIRSTGGHRVAIYERTRPEVEAHFTGRRDF
jgi:hypothetical protein